MGATEQESRLQLISQEILSRSRLDALINVASIAAPDALADVLAKEGLAEIDTDGKFDPHIHEALLSQPSEAEEGSVIEVVQKGYKLGDRVVRPARVVVASPQEDDA